MGFSRELQSCVLSVRVRDFLEECLTIKIIFTNPRE